MLIALATLLTLLAAYYGWRHRQLAIDGTTAPAISIRAERETVSGKNPTGDPYRYFAVYEFAAADGRVHRARQSIGRGLYDELVGGVPAAAVAVHYSRSHPEVSALSRHAPRNVAMVLALLAAAAWVGLALRMTRG